jgi:signal transduction histidine kinase
VSHSDANRLGSNTSVGSQENISAPVTQTRVMTPGLALGFLAIIVVLVAGVLITLANLATVYRATTAVAHTSAVKAQLEALLTSLIDAETGERGFLITGDDGYLEPYTRGVAATAIETARVRQLTIDNAEQRVDLEHVAVATQIKLEELAAAIQTRREKGFEGAQAVVLTNVGKRTMDGIRATVTRMEAREDGLLASRTAQADRAYGAARLTAFGVGAVGLLVVFALFVVARRVGTERHRTERERLNLIAELEAAVRARDDFLSIASHELRNPVNAVHLQLVGIVRSYQRATTEVREDELRHRIIQASAQVSRLTRLLDNLLDVSRISAGSIVLEPEELDLAEVVSSALDQVRGESSDGQIRFADRHPVIGRWDRLRVEQVVSNLLSNAIKYGEGRPIVISLRHDDRFARLAVTDHGIGIAPEQHERLFAQFERGVSRRQYGGFGLGLWITRQLVDAMGGSISVDSRTGEGATFSIALPLDTAQTPSMRTSA